MPNLARLFDGAGVEISWISLTQVCEENFSILVHIETTVLFADIRELDTDIAFIGSSE